MYCWPGAPIILAAFAPDKGESVNTLIADPPARRPGAAHPATQGRLPAAGRDKFHGSFAADLPAEQAAFMADSQVP
jgi:hypothetical protein